MARTRCPRKGCEELDSREHFKSCYGVAAMAEMQTEKKVNCLAALSKRIKVNTQYDPNRQQFHTEERGEC